MATSKKTLKSAGPSFILNDKNIQALDLDNKSSDIIHATDEGFTRGAIYSLNSMSASEMNHRIGQETPESLKKKFSKHWYGASALHWAMLNPDINVFKTILQTFKDNALDVQKLQYASETRKTKNSNNLIVHKGDSLLNCALSVADKDKISLLVSEKLTSFNLPALLTHDMTYFRASYEINGEDINRYQSNILDYCTYLMCTRVSDKMTQREINNFYMDFMLSFGSFDEILGLQPYESGNLSNYEFNKQVLELKYASTKEEQSISITAIMTQAFSLLNQPRLFDNENFTKFFLPFIVSKFVSNQDRIDHSRIFDVTVLNYRKLGLKINWFESIVDNFLNSNLAKDSSAQNIILHTVQSFKEVKYLRYIKENRQAENVGELVDNAMKRLKSGIEKQMLESHIGTGAKTGALNKI